MSDFNEGEPKPTEFVSDQDTLAFIDHLVSNWDFDTHTTAENAFFTMHLAHWTLEVFGQGGQKGNYALYPATSYGEGFPFDELPGDIKQLVMTEHYGELYRGDSNSITMISTPEVHERDAYIPKWEEISKIPSFQGMLEAARNDPEVMAMLIPPVFEITPGVNLQFSPAPYFHWGLQYILRPTGIEVVPYGDFGKTTVPFMYAVEAQGRPQEVAKTACELVKLAARHTLRHNRDVVDSSMCSLFIARLEGKTSIPIGNIECDSSPGNGIKNLLISYLMSGEEYPG